MSRYQLVDVDSPEHIKEFLEFPSRLYREEPTWSRPLDRDIEKIFDPATNKKFRHGEAIRWILKEGNDTVGRVAAFYDKKAVSTKKVNAGGMGFFDCINDKDAAFLLFDACRDWLSARGMTAMDGPVNFGERDSFWGCLVDGYHEPLYNMPYNYPYYKDLFEAYGFKNFFYQYTYHKRLDIDELDDIVRDKGKRVIDNPDYRFEIYDHKDSDRQSGDFAEIFNEAWGRFPGVTRITKAHTKALLRQLRPIMDSRLIHLAYYKDKPVGFFIMMQDISQVTKTFKGKLNLLKKLQLIYAVRVKKSVTRVIGRIFGVVPSHHGKGVEAGLIMSFYKYLGTPGFHYTDLELNWIGDFNPTMMKVCEQIGSKILKTHITYRCMFDPDASFERADRVNI
jgi:hypothetical protein